MFSSKLFELFYYFNSFIMTQEPLFSIGIKYT